MEQNRELPVIVVRANSDFVHGSGLRVLSVQPGSSVVFSDGASCLSVERLASTMMLRLGTVCFFSLFFPIHLLAVGADERFLLVVRKVSGSVMVTGVVAVHIEFVFEHSCKCWLNFLASRLAFATSIFLCFFFF